jgi:very-short-patch-repair endonuclease
LVSAAGSSPENCKFKRQEWVGSFIASFSCWGAKIIVEADGSQHQDRAEYGAARDRFFRARR